MTTIPFLSSAAALLPGAVVLALLSGCGEEAGPGAVDETADAGIMPTATAKKHCPGEFDENRGDYTCTVQRGALTAEDLPHPEALEWIPEVTYRLAGNVRIEEAELTIRAGTTILGETDTLKSSPAALHIAKTATIQALGTADAPIVFTSANPEGSRAPGDWGGVSLEGDAPMMEASSNDRNPDHSAGTLAHVRIEFTGAPTYTLQGSEMQAGESPPGLDLNAVGRKTELHHVHVHRAAGNGVTIDGGTVGLKQVLVTGAASNGLSWGRGWTGNAQFAIVQSLEDAPTQTLLRGENQGAGGKENALPRSEPTLYNVTLDPTPDTTNAIVLGGGTAGVLANLLVTDQGAATCLDIKSDASWEQTLSGALAIAGSILPDDEACFADDDTTGYHETHWFGDVASNRMENITLEPAADSDKTGFSVPEGSPARQGSVAPPAGVSFFRDVAFVGAVGAVDWTQGWTEFPAD